MKAYIVHLPVRVSSDQNNLENYCLFVSECDLSVDRGTCSGKFNRYYYDSSSGQCKMFYYTGCGGNLNNFQSLSECNKRCICSRPVDEGPCDKRRLRYFYNQGTKLCQLFVYGGCDGNNNNFRSEEACENVCGSDVKPRCLRRPEYGHCSNQTERYYYDSNCGCCQTFTYSGCKGNNNNFVSEQRCLNICLGAERSTVPTSSTSTTVPTTSSATDDPRPARCHFEKKRGPCSSQIRRYYYDKRVNSCKIFLWSGCGGNGNNFRSRRFCTQTCAL